MSEKDGVIYKALCLVNKKAYVGRTLYFKKRKAEHIKGSIKKKTLFHRAIQKYGAVGFCERHRSQYRRGIIDIDGNKLREPLKIYRRNNV